jgi:hypothetical protein
MVCYLFGQVAGTGLPTLLSNWLNVGSRCQNKFLVGPGESAAASTTTILLILLYWAHSWTILPPHIVHGLCSSDKSLGRTFQIDLLTLDSFLWPFACVVPRPWFRIYLISRTRHCKKQRNVGRSAIKVRVTRSFIHPTICPCAEEGSPNIRSIYPTTFFYNMILFLGLQEN